MCVCVCVCENIFLIVQIFIVKKTTMNFFSKSFPKSLHNAICFKILSIIFRYFKPHHYEQAYDYS